MNSRVVLEFTVAILCSFIVSTPTVLAQADEGMEIDLVTHNNVVIQATPQRIWPYIIDPSEWKAGARMVLIEGSAHQASGKFKAVMPDTPDQVAFYAQNVEIDPERRRAVRLNLPDGTLMGFAIWELSPQDIGTRVEYHVYSLIEYPDAALAGMDEEQRAALRNDYLASNAQRFQGELEALRQLVEHPRVE